MVQLGPRLAKDLLIVPKDGYWGSGHIEAWPGSPSRNIDQSAHYSRHSLLPHHPTLFDIG